MIFHSYVNVYQRVVVMYIMFPRETHGFLIWGVALLGDLRGNLADHRERHACCCAVPSGLEDLRDRNRDRSYRRKNINSEPVKHSKTVKPFFWSVHSWKFRIVNLTIVFLPLKFQKYGWTWHENTFVYLSFAFFSRISTSQTSLPRFEAFTVIKNLLTNGFSMHGWSLSQLFWDDESNMDL